MEMHLANERMDRPSNKRIIQGQPYRRLLLFLSLLDVALLIIMVTMAVLCAQVGKEVPKTAVSRHVLEELEDLRSRHLEAVKVTEKTWLSFEKAVKARASLMHQIEQQQFNNDLYFEQIQELKYEKSVLQSNISALEGSCHKCPDQWLYFNSSCYFFSYINEVGRLKTWERSRDDCRSRGADLAVMDRYTEQTFVTNNILYMKRGERIDLRIQNPESFWIGLRDVYGNGTWVWLNNVTEVYRRPKGNIMENCALKSGYANNAAYCRNAYYWICEMESS